MLVRPTDPRERIVGGVAQHHQHGGVALDPLGRVALAFQVREQQRGRPVAWRIPAGESVGEVDGRPLPATGGERGAQRLQRQPHLQVGHHEGRRQDLEADHPLQHGLLDVLGGQRVLAAGPDRAGDPVDDLQDEGPSARAGIEQVDAGIGQPLRQPELGAQHRVHALHHVPRDRAGGEPHAQLLAHLGIEGGQEGLVEILDGLALLEFAEEGSLVDPVERPRRRVEEVAQVYLLHAVGRDQLRQ